MDTTNTSLLTYRGIRVGLYQTMKGKPGNIGEPQIVGGISFTNMKKESPVAQADVTIEKGTPFCVLVENVLLDWGIGGMAAVVIKVGGLNIITAQPDDGKPAWIDGFGQNYIYISGNDTGMRRQFRVDGWVIPKGGILQFVAVVAKGGVKDVAAHKLPIELSEDAVEVRVWRKDGNRASDVGIGAGGLVLQKFPEDPKAKERNFAALTREDDLSPVVFRFNLTVPETEEGEPDPAAFFVDGLKPA